MIKTIVNNEFFDVGVNNTIEIKALFVIDPEIRKGKGYGSKLYQEALKIANQTGADNLAVTISCNKTESLAFFTRKDFEIRKDMPDKYIQGKTEYLIIKKIK